MELKDFREIALHAAQGTAPTNFTSNQVEASFRDGLAGLCGSVNQFMKNRYDIYEILVEAIDLVTPKKVLSTLSAFAEVQVVGEAQRAIFKTKVGRNRAKKFLTYVALSGVYETFRLDSTTFEVKTHAVGMAATIDFQRMIDGAESLAEVMDVVTECMSDAVILEVQKALSAAYASGKFPNANKATGNTFVADNMVSVMNTVKAYGDGVAIFATPAFIATMGADAIVPASAVGQGVYHPDDIDAIHNTGLIRIFRGAPVIEIPQSFIDEKNEKCWIDDQYAYILPTGKEKVVKVVLEGATQVKDHENKDNSIEVEVWKKIGTAIFTYYNWGIYQNTALAGHNATPYEGLE